MWFWLKSSKSGLINYTSLQVSSQKLFYVKSYNKIIVYFVKRFVLKVNKHSRSIMVLVVYLNEHAINIRAIYQCQNDGMAMNQIGVCEHCVRRTSLVAISTKQEDIPATGCQSQPPNPICRPTELCKLLSIFLFDLVFTDRPFWSLPT